MFDHDGRSRADTGTGTLEGSGSSCTNAAAAAIASSANEGTSGSSSSSSNASNGSSSSIPRRSGSGADAPSTPTIADATWRQRGHRRDSRTVRVISHSVEHIEWKAWPQEDSEEIGWEVRGKRHTQHRSTSSSRPRPGTSPSGV
ncbi:hypothetical protein PENTCL1PPCAC_13917, partial [Pristionchus entomophagus]